MESSALIFIAIIAFIVIALLSSLSTRLGGSISTGRIGEAYISSILSRLGNEDYHCIDNLMLLDHDGSTTQIDHIVVSHFGIFVVETKTFNGWIFGDENSKQWMQVFPSHWYNENKFPFQNPVQQNWRHIYILADTLDLPKRYFENIVVFCGSAEFKTIRPENVLSPIELLSYIYSFTTPLISKSKVEYIYSKLLSLNFEVNDEQRKNHIRNLRKRKVISHHVATGSSSPKCPYCGRPMRLRHRKSDNVAFYGCSQYPHCKGIINIV